MAHPGGQPTSLMSQQALLTCNNFACRAMLRGSQRGMRCGDVDHPPRCLARMHGGRGGLESARRACGSQFKVLHHSGA